MQPNNVDPTPWSTQWSQSILKISMMTHGALSKGDGLMLFALRLLRKSHVARRFFRQGAPKPTLRSSSGVQSHRQQIPASHVACVFANPPPSAPLPTSLFIPVLLRRVAYIYVAICMLELYLSACSRQGSQNILCRISNRL